MGQVYLDEIDPAIYDPFTWMQRKLQCATPPLHTAHTLSRHSLPLLLFSLSLPCAPHPLRPLEEPRSSPPTLAPHSTPPSL